MHDGTIKQRIRAYIKLCMIGYTGKCVTESSRLSPVIITDALKSYFQSLADSHACYSRFLHVFQRSL